ncbi:sigma-70 family RNA polymerase sigma factor [Hymenobacter sp. 5516J-16]|nr:sigma-70 family RNA polymerase sigma factor [Hymenobacter sp. 5516J-16]UOQ79106.1 sigma-70 family RNA polymerase sigma factor [Hymenobacter sp. 5516J-16]
MAVCLRYAQTTFEAEDVLQEGFLTVFKNLASFRRECPLEFWIRRIMVNAALRQHRRNAPWWPSATGASTQRIWPARSLRFPITISRRC